MHPADNKKIASIENIPLVCKKVGRGVIQGLVDEGEQKGVEVGVGGQQMGELKEIGCVFYRKVILRCSVDFSVPFTNNQAERDLRMMNVHQNRSGGFRSESGATKTFCRNRGYISTVKKNGLSPIKAIFDALNGSFVYLTKMRCVSGYEYSSYL